MRRRLRKFLPIVLMALVVQIFAPIAACWAASLALSDPLYAAEICHSESTATSGQADQNGGDHQIHDAACCISCTALGGVSFDAPQQSVIEVPYRQTTGVVWHEDAPDLSCFRTGSYAQARAPPSFS